MQIVGSDCRDTFCRSEFAVSVADFKINLSPFNCLLFCSSLNSEKINPLPLG